MFEVAWFFPPQVTSTAVDDYSNLVWLHSAVPVIFCHFPLYVNWFMDDFRIRYVGGKKDN